MKYFVHNFVGHPAKAVADAFGLRSLGLWLHNVTLPADNKDKASLFDLPVNPR